MRYHLIVYVPTTAAADVRLALTEAGAGKIGTYDSCSFSSAGTGRFRPLKGAHPTIGSIGELEEVEEERIEAMVDAPSEAALRAVVSAVRKAHPYEEPAIHVLPMLSL